MTNLETLEELEELLDVFIDQLRGAVGDVNAPLGRAALTTPTAPDELSLGARTVVLRESYGLATAHRVNSLLLEVPRELPAYPRGGPSRSPVSADAALREPELPLFVVYCDERSAKMSTLPPGAPASLLFYDSARRLQGRMALQRLALSEAERLRRWDTLSLRQRRDYQSAEAPGHRVNSIEESHRQRESSTGDGREREREDAEHFTALIFELHLLEILQLNRAGHRRGIFRPLPWSAPETARRTGSSPRSWEASWLVP